MARYPAMTPIKKVRDELRSCKGCNMTVMAKGDFHGWKGIDMGQAQMWWYCDKLPCRQLRDETIANRSKEMVVEQQQHAVRVEESVKRQDLEAENEALKARVAELERQSSAPRSPEDARAELAEPEALAEPDYGRVNRDAPPEPTEPPSEASAPVESHIIGDPSKNHPVALCGATDGPMLKAIELTWDTNPCTACATLWAKIQAGEDAPKAPEEPGPHPPGVEYETQVRASSGAHFYQVTLADGTWGCQCDAFKYRQTCRHITESQAKYARLPVPELPAPSPQAEPEPAPAQPSSAAAALYGERPVPPVLENLPRFTPSLISKVNDSPGTYVGKTVLVPPEAYPDLDMAVVEAERLRDGISGMFSKAGLQVDRIERATKDGKVQGVVFTLRRS